MSEAVKVSALTALSIRTALAGVEAQRPEDDRRQNRSMISPVIYLRPMRHLHRHRRSPGVPAVPRFETVEPKYSFRADPFAVGDDARADGPVDVIEELR